MTPATNNKVHKIPEQAETQVCLTAAGYIYIWQDGLGGSEETSILIHPLFIPLFLEAIKAALSELPNEA